ncbi:MAG: hypothetical protein ABID04_01475 [Patescibacteria group bacterium]
MINNPAGALPKNNRYLLAKDIILANTDFLIIANGQDFDSLAAATGFLITLESIGKSGMVYAPGFVNSGKFSGLNGLGKISDQLNTEENRLTIGFDYPLEHIEKVASDDAGDKLSLIVELKDGAPNISPQQVSIRPPAKSFRAGFVFDQLLPDQSLFSQGDWVWFSRNPQPQAWAKVSIAEPKASLSESIVGVSSQGGIMIPTLAAENFYAGIRYATSDFSQADSVALETAAYCLKIKERSNPANMVQPAMPDQMMGGQMPASFQAPLDQGFTQPVSTSDVGPIETVEAKESGVVDGNLNRPSIFTGKTTPKV